ncbi:MAG: hypothetical protein P1U85_16175, partial [Verrucomicrobiales bacterium]|nr:hypothetical protein [Verrucomicrobiales bacterium]
MLAMDERTMATENRASLPFQGDRQETRQPQQGLPERGASRNQAEASIILDHPRSSSIILDHPR